MKNNTPIYKLAAIILLAALLTGLTGCGQTVAEKEKVTVQLSWFHDPEFSGFYTAIEKGFYAEEGLDVTLKAGGPDVDPIKEIMADQAQFGIVPANAIIKARSNGQDLVAISSIYQANPFLIMTLKNSGIKTPKDLEGKRISIQSPDNFTDQDTLLLSMLKRMNVDQSTIQFVATDEWYGADELTKGKADAAAAFLTNQPVQAKLQGVEVDTMLYSDYGIPFYANLISTSGNLIKNKPDLVQKFVRATLRGYQYAIEHPEEAAGFTHKYNESGNTDYDTAAIKAMIPLIDTGATPIGWMDAAPWQSTSDIMFEFKLITNRTDVSAAYTTKFVEGSK